jgi:hypothetical protein
MQTWTSNFASASRLRSQSRREFLRSAGMTFAQSRLWSILPTTAVRQVHGTKTVVVTFGGGARDEETFAPEGQRYIPNLLGELLPQGTFYTQVVNRGILGHYVATASLASGCYETFNNFAPVSPLNPTIFEYYRKGLRRQARDVWIVAPSNGFQGIGESTHGAYGDRFGATVVLPKRLLEGAEKSNIPQLDGLLQDSYESPLSLPSSPASEVSLHELSQLMRISVADFQTHARSVRSADELSLYIAKHVMDTIAPSVLWVTLHDIDVAHSGAFSLYTEAITRSDLICAEIWKTIQSNPEYKGRTNLFILPDFGRDGDDEPSGNGFQHHRTGDALSRTTWLLAIGPGIRENTVVDRAVESIDLAPTLGRLLGCDTPLAQGHLLQEVL